MFGEGAHAQINARKVEPLARAQFTAHDDAAADIDALDLIHIDLDQAIVQIERVARLHHLVTANSPKRCLTVQIKRDAATYIPASADLCIIGVPATEQK